MRALVRSAPPTPPPPTPYPPPRLRPSPPWRPPAHGTPVTPLHIPWWVLAAGWLTPLPAHKPSSPSRRQGGEPAVAYENADDINDINGAGVSYMNHVPATYSVAKPKKAPQALAAATAPGVGGPAVPDAELSFVPLAVAAEAKATAAAAAADPAQAWAAADFRHPAAIDAARGGMAGGPKHAYMNVQLTANGDEEAAAVLQLRHPVGSLSHPLLTHFSALCAPHAPYYMCRFIYIKKHHAERVLTGACIRWWARFTSL